MIPILREHNQEAVIGTFQDEGIVTLIKPLSKDELFQIFGNIGFMALETIEVAGIQKMKKVHILEWSL